MKAMVLAAGLGTRMGPLCARRPKPVLPVLDEPLLARMLRTLAEAGVCEAVVNAHAYRDQLTLAVRDAPLAVRLSHEPELLGSGGGILAARRWLDGPDPFLVVNADMFLDLDLEYVRARHRHARRRFGACATLLLRDEPRKAAFGTLGYDRDGMVVRITSLAADPDEGTRREVGNGLFTGVQVLEPEVFDHMPTRDTFDTVRDLYAPWIASGTRNLLHSVAQAPSSIWEPVGSPGELLDVNLAELRRRSRAAERPAEIDLGDAGPTWVGAGARIDASARVGRDTIVGAGAVVGPGSILEESLVLPHARPPAGAKLERAIAYDDEIWRDG